MNKRLAIQEIATLLSARTGKTLQETELFLREFINVVSEGILKDKIVKVKGLGTFKILLVEDRESIHVNTGERILIPAHYKYTFTPDTELKELVNRPFSIFETTEINSSVTFSDIEESDEDDDEPESEEDIFIESASITADNNPGEQDLTKEEAEQAALSESDIKMEELVEPEAISVLETISKSEQNESPKTEKVQISLDSDIDPAIRAIIAQRDEESISDTLKGPESVEKTKTEGTFEEQVPESNEDKIEPLPIEPSEIQTSNNPEPQRDITGNTECKSEEASSEISPVNNAEPKSATHHHHKHRRNLFLKTVVYSVAGILAVIIAIGFFFYYQTKEVKEIIPVKVESVSEFQTMADSIPDSLNVVSSPDTLQREALQPAVKEPEPEPESSEYLDAVKIKPGNRLTLLALKYYGHKIFWVYIYMENKSTIPDPDQVPIGATIYIPMPQKYGIDVNNQSSLDKADKLQTRILNGQ